MGTPFSDAAIVRFCLALSAALPVAIRAEHFFRPAQALTPDHEIDALVWRVDAAEAIDSAWDCQGADWGLFKPSSCAVVPYKRSSSALDNYLYWAFLNMDRRSERADLGARDADDQAAFTQRGRPLLALKQRGDSCLYLVLFRDELAPLAGGRVACPDLSRGLAGVAADLQGRDRLIPKAKGEPPRALRRSGTFTLETPNSLDFALEAGAALAIPLSQDKDADPNNPFSTPEQTFDFDDYADAVRPPLSLRATLLYRNVLGLRLGYSSSTFAMTDEMRSVLAEAIAAQGGTLTDWDIVRKDWTTELLLGGSAMGATAEFPFYGILGFGKSVFYETATINGGSYPNQKLLRNVSAVLVGGGGQVRLPYFFIGLEMCFLIKDFEIRNATSQPDGGGSEFQIRIYSGSFYRVKLGRGSAG